MQDSATAAPQAYAEVAQALGVNTEGLSDAEAASRAAPAYDTWLREVGLRLSLDDHGLSADDAERVAKLCFEPENKVMLESDSFEYSLESLTEASSRMLSAA
jgi:alcohol dehydrogenase class IV